MCGISEETGCHDSRYAKLILLADAAKFSLPASERVSFLDCVRVEYLCIGDGEGSVDAILTGLKYGFYEFNILINRVLLCDFVCALFCVV